MIFIPDVQAYPVLQTLGRALLHSLWEGACLALLLAAALWLLRGRSPNARYVRVRAESYGKLPAWHPGAGGDSWIFVDEIIVE